MSIQQIPVKESIGQRSDWREGARLLAAAATAAWLGFFLLTISPWMGLEVFQPTIVLHAVAVAGLLTWVAYLALSKRLPGGSPLDWPIAGVLVVYGLSAMTAVDIRVSIESFLTVLSAALAFYILSDLRFLRARHLAWGLMAAGAAGSIYALWVVGGDYLEWLRLSRAVGGEGGIAGLLPPSVPRVHGVSDNPNILAMILALLLPLYAALGCGASSWWGKAAGIGGLALAGAALFFTQSRGAWAGALAGLVVLAAMVAGAEFARARRAGGLRLPNAAVVASAGVGCVLVVGLAGLFLAQWDSRPEWLFRSSLSPRQDAMEAGYSILKDYPLLGAGPGSFALLYPDYSGEFPIHAVHAHNGFLQTGVETGLLGLTATAALVTVVFWMLWRTARRGDERLRLLAFACAAGLVAFGLHNLVDAGNIWKSSLLALAAVGALAARAHGESAAASASPLVIRQAQDERPDGVWLVAMAKLTPRAAILLGVPLLLLGWYRSDVSHYYYERGVEAVNEGRFAEGIDYLNEAVERDQRMALYRLELGLAQVMAHQNGAPRAFLTDGVESLRQGVELDPRSAIGYANLAKGLALKGDSIGALEAALRARELGKADDTLLVMVGETLEAIGADEEAVATYSEAITRNGDIADSAFWEGSPFRKTNYARILGGSLLALNDCAMGELMARSEEASSSELRGLVEKCGRAVEESPGDLGRRVSYATLLMATGDADGAKSQIDYVLAHQPDHAEGRTALGKWYDLRGRTEESRRELAAGGNLGDPEGVTLLVKSYPAGQAPNEAVEELRKTLYESAKGFGHHIEGYLYYRARFWRMSPVTVLVPGDWLSAQPRSVVEMEEALAPYR